MDNNKKLCIETPGYGPRWTLDSMHSKGESLYYLTSNFDPYLVKCISQNFFMVELLGTPISLSQRKEQMKEQILQHLLSEYFIQKIFRSTHLKV